MSKVVIFGVGDYARIASVYLDEDSPHEVVAFTADAEHVDSDELLGRPVHPFDQLTNRYPPSEHEMLVAVAYSRVNKARAEIFERCKDLGYGCITYVSSKATCVGDVKVGENSFVFDENTLQPFVEIGDNCVLWSGNHIGHDSKLGAHCFITSHVVISGNCRVGDYCFIGVNATLRDGLTIGPECVIGAGATMLKDAERGGVYPGAGTEPIPKKSWELKRI
jgi:sugar O-acyltransferase (sialic acid O-acetyltransferase NeuD family)